MKKEIITTTIVLMFGITMAFAQSKDKADTIKSTSTIVQQIDSVYYTCPMHNKLKMDKPGKCPSCGMVLEKRTTSNLKTIINNKEIIEIYSCPIHADVKSDKACKCAKCGMDLIVTK